MLVANSFDLWQKDDFFSAAEEVQQSADLMESAYRAWSRARKEESVTEHLEELSEELQIALGTAKWQLEEFEKAVFVSYKSHGNDATMRRHNDFISCMRHQISKVENHFVEQKKPFRWVNLNENERDDLASFLSGVSTQPRVNPVSENMMISQKVETGCPDQSSSQIMHSTHRARGSSYQDMLEIVIDRNERTREEAIGTSKKKSRLSKCDEHCDAKCSHKLNPRIGICHVYRHLVSPVMAVKSVRTMLVLMLTILLVVPFLMYSS